MKNQIEDKNDLQRFEAIFFLAAIALIVVGLNGNTPLIVVGGGIIFLIILRRYSANKNMP